MLTKNLPDPPRPGALLAWYATHARALPWRSPPSARRRCDPYRVWLSEVMLQQTSVAAVIPYFEAFTMRWPGIEALAAASLDDVLTEWAGLGYYARARNLHKCAKMLAETGGGRFPETQDELRGLPGIGPYTAAAIAAIAFDRPATPVDGNVERVMARAFGVNMPLPSAKKKLTALAERLTADLEEGASPGDYAQAVMDLGATICTPRAPKCDLCPWHENCAANAQGIAETLPRRAPKAKRPIRRGYAYWVTRQDGAVLLRRRPEAGLLGGMMEFPCGDWRTGRLGKPEHDAPLALDWRQLPGRVTHTFTHFHLELTVMAASAPRGKVAGKWVHPDAFGNEALPSVMRKVARHVLASPTPP